MKKVRTGHELFMALEVGREMTEDEIVVMLQKITLDAFNELVVRSARDFGFLRSNWDVVVDVRPPNESLDNPTERSFPDASIPSIRIKSNSIIVLFNNTEYAIWLEQGTPKMRAQPMIEPTHQMLMEVTRNLSKILSNKRLDL